MVRKLEWYMLNGNRAVEIYSPCVAFILQAMQGTLRPAVLSVAAPRWEKDHMFGELEAYFVGVKKTTFIMGSSI